MSDLQSIGAYVTHAYTYTPSDTKLVEAEVTAYFCRKCHNALDWDREYPTPPGLVIARTQLGYSFDSSANHACATCRSLPTDRMHGATVVYKTPALALPDTDAWNHFVGHAVLNPAERCDRTERIEAHGALHVLEGLARQYQSTSGLWLARALRYDFWTRHGHGPHPMVTLSLGGVS